MGRFIGGPPRPAHAQPGPLASLGRRSLLQWAAAVLAALAVVATTLGVPGDGGGAPAAVPAPAPAKDRPVARAALGWTLSTSPVQSETATHSPSHTHRASTRHSPRTEAAGLAAASALAAGGIPLTALQAYRNAARQENLTDPACRIPWPLLAAIGRVESDHGRFAGAVLHTDGLSTPRIIGIPLDGSRSALIRDTDHGRLDGDRVYDRAVGPMQFIPSTWASYRTDGNGDGVTDPFNIFDAAATAARYLCTAGGDLATAAGQQRAVLAYNHSDAYVTAVLRLEKVYASGVPGLRIPVLPTTPPPAVPRDVPPANPAPPPALTTTAHRPTPPPTSRQHTPTTGAAGSPHSTTRTPPSGSAEPGSTSPAATSTPPGTPSTSPTTTPAPSCPSPSTTSTSPSPGTSPPSGTASTATSTAPATSSPTSTGTLVSQNASRGEQSCPSTVSTTPCSTSPTPSAAHSSTATCSTSASSSK